MEDPDPPLQMDHHTFDEDELIQLSFLRDEETDALIAARLLDHELRLNSPLDSEVIFELPELSLRVTAGALYPVQTPTWQVENKSLPRERADSLRRRLREVVADAEKSNNLSRWESREDADTGFGIFDPAMVILQLAQEAQRHTDAYRSDKAAAATNGASSGPDKHTWFFGESTKAGVDVVPLNQLTLRETAYQLLKLSPAEIAALVPGHCRVLHVEQVLRPDLAQDLYNFQSRLRGTLSRKSADALRPFMPKELRGTRRVEDMIDHLVRPRITFHGTQRHHVPGIVRHGFIAPGKHNPETATAHGVRCGSTYGRGVYSTPNAGFALSYSSSYNGEDYRSRRTDASEYHGIKLVVCATVMGRSRLMYRDDGWREESEAFEGFDSHVANEGLEYIVFSRAQTIPVYVVHLDWGANNAEYFHNLPNDPRAWAAHSDRRSRAAEAKLTPREVCPGDLQRAKEAVFARATKWFPYGFGPAAGTRFVVEEVGEVSEDEEEYGEYQALRGDEDDDEDGQNGKDFWAWVKVAAVEEDGEDEGDGRGLGKMLEGAHLADEYGDERKALRVPLGYKKKTSVWDEMASPGSGAALEMAARAKHDDGFHLDVLMMEGEGH